MLPAQTQASPPADYQSAVQTSQGFEKRTSATDVTLAPSVWPRLETALETAAAADAPVLDAAFDAADVPARPCSTGPARIEEQSLQ